MKTRVSVSLTEAELWELINNFGQAFQSGLPENALADHVMAKLQKAHSKVSAAPKEKKWGDSDFDYIGHGKGIR